MATSGKLEVQIGADITDFEKKIKEVEYDIKELSKVKLEKIKLGLDTTVINAQIKDAKNNLNGLKTAVRDTGGAVAGMAPKVANGSNALMQFSRIAQDAPYGIIGIGNNITSTVEAFGHLKNSTGTAGGALRAMASSLMGTGGILLAVSLLTTGLTLLSQSGMSIGDVFDKITGNVNSFKDALKNVNEEAFKDKGVQEVISNVNELTNEIGLAKKGFLDKDQVVNHYNETIGKTTGLVKDIDQAEKELVKNGDAYIKMTLYKAAANLALEEAAKKSLEAEKSRLKKISDFKNEFTDAPIGMVTDKMREKLQVEYAERQKLRQQKEVKANQDAANANLNIAKKFQSDAAKISKGFGFNFFGDTKDSNDGKIEKRPKIKSVIDFEKVDPDKIAAEYKKQFDVISEALGGQAKLQPIDLNIPLTPILDTGFIPAFQLELDALAESINTLIDDYIGPSLASIGTSIGEAIATGSNVIGAIGQSLLQSFAGYLSEMGDMLIKYGLLAITKGKIDLAILAGGPVAIGAGIAAIAVGVLLKAASGALGAKAKGGSGGGGVSSSTGNGANNSSTTSGGGYGWSGGGNNTVVFEIAGTSLIGVLNNTTERNLRIGGRS